MKKLILATVISFSLLLFAGAGAQAELNFGVKSLTYHNSILPWDQSAGSYFGFDAGSNIVLLGGLDYGRLGVKLEAEYEEYNIDTEVSVSYIMPHAGIKFYLKPRQQGKVSPYLLGEVEKVFTSVDLGDLLGELELEDGIEVEEPVEDLLSPFGILAAFGSEYYFSDNFGIGGEVGVRILSSSAEMSDEELPVEISMSRYFIYSGFSFNFKL